MPWRGHNQMFKKIIDFWHKKMADQNTAGQDLLNLVDRQKMPGHIAIIMDGNGRWAQRRGLPRAAGHRAGVESLREVIKLCCELNIQVLTVYAFSTENWKRPQDEVNILMGLLVEYINKEINELHQNGVRINPIGRVGDLPRPAVEALIKAVKLTRENKTLILNVALNYGGRTEIIDAVRAIAADVKVGSLKPGQIDTDIVSSYLYTAGQPDPDLLIRPSADFRISNFLLWQLAYTEFWFTSTLWPDFRRSHLLQALVDFQRRERRFGGLK
ncbi:MAG: Isoprenyl transferase [Pelotomaculum sp. PtaB.Bin104]|nr:MAG: Isoprenyl transferase [Pelotomaculum sp. PtaB.Bin104]